jgi:hypothetical protein
MSRRIDVASKLNTKYGVRGWSFTIQELKLLYLSQEQTKDLLTFTSGRIYIVLHPINDIIIIIITNNCNLFR